MVSTGLQPICLGRSGRMEQVHQSAPHYTHISLMPKPTVCVSFDWSSHYTLAVLWLASPPPGIPLALRPLRCIVAVFIPISPILIGIDTRRVRARHSKYHRAIILLEIGMHARFSGADCRCQARFNMFTFSVSSFSAGPSDPYMIFLIIRYRCCLILWSYAFIQDKKKNASFPGAFS